MRPRCTEARGPAKAERRRASFWKAKAASATERSGPSVVLERPASDGPQNLRSASRDTGRENWIWQIHSPKPTSKNPHQAPQFMRRHYFHHRTSFASQCKCELQYHREKSDGEGWYEEEAKRG